MKIHGGIHIGIAVIMYGYSTFMESKVDTNLILFKYVAIAFLIWGAFRLTVDFITKEKPKKEEVGPPYREPQIEPQKFHNPHAQHQHTRPQPHTTHTHVQQPRHVSYPHPHSIKCPRCHKPVMPGSRFCSSCGLKF